MMKKEKYRSMFDAFHTEHKNPIRQMSGWVFYVCVVEWKRCLGVR